jgi:hypothetical protein
MPPSHISRAEAEAIYERGRQSGIADERENAAKAGVLRGGRYVTPDARLEVALAALEQIAASPLVRHGEMARVAEGALAECLALSHSTRGQ